MAKLRSRQGKPIRFARTTSQRAGFRSGFFLAEGQAAPFVLAEHYQFVLSAGETSPFNDKSGNNEPARAVQKSSEHGGLQFLNFGWLYECADILTVMAITECAYYACIYVVPGEQAVFRCKRTGRQSFGNFGLVQRQQIERVRKS